MEQNDTTNTPLGQKLKELRYTLGLSLYEVETRSGVNRAKLMRLENGTITKPTTETLNKLAQCLEVDPEELYDVAWATGPLPSLPTYFRSKYSLDDNTIAAIERTIERAGRKPTKEDLTAESPSNTRTPTQPKKQSTKKGGPP